MTSWTHQTSSERNTNRLGRWLAEALPDRAVIALIGTLGSGKTHLVRAIAAADGVNPRDVVSPTFVLLQQYQGKHTISHFDAYRLKDDDEFLQLGPEEYFEGPGWSLIEWADRVASCLPRDLLRIEIQVTGDQAREFTLSSDSPAYEQCLARLRALAAGETATK